MKAPFHQRVLIGIVMCALQEIDPDKDYTIPRPQTTNFNEPYDEYYGHN